MRLVSLLFDPRGAVDRRGFWSGLLQLTVLSLLVYLGLSQMEWTVGVAALPGIGEAFVVGYVAGEAYGDGLPDVTLAASLLLVAARLYVTACLMLKRARHAGKGPGVVVAFGLSTLLVHVLMGLWAYSLFGEDMAVILPMLADLVVAVGLGLGFTLWLGVLRGSPGLTLRQPRDKNRKTR
ncbi:hypothetical protein PMI01_03102 [Caulobacter sp. AP07]|uniref:hypothetical protein n=1 Tax=Caulobacter sp. AP07 TaxID=1144304 RepID=UPI000271F7B1|nr:hypothetical protein [Caulobacter sp. AP07]EJL30550.1 hypothetical protein PMI01_03102 [Caulobacter sp. AP07]